MRLLDRLFKRKAKSIAEETRLASKTETRPVTPEATAPIEINPKPEGPYLTETVVFGVRRPGEDSAVCFVDEEQGIRKQLVDSDGNIQDFPGIVEEEFWTKQVSPRALKPQIHFRTSFEKRENGWLMLWNIQPDGRYWADDDGFGMEDEEEVTLYAYVDKNGQFTGPFQVYRVGGHHYSLDRFEHQRVECHSKNLQKLNEWNLATQYAQKPEDLLFPRLRGTTCYDYFELWDRDEALAYWNHPVLSKDLLEATEILLNTQRPISELGDCRCKNHIRASMTLFWLLTEDARFQSVLDKFYDGELDKATADRLG
ncbi:MAG: DUF1810 family protein [Faecousia sp.]